MRRIALVVVVLCLAGCHSPSAAGLTEAHTDAAVGQKVDHDWDKYTDAQKHVAVHKLTRGLFSVLSDADGTVIPAEYADVASSSGTGQ